MIYFNTFILFQIITDRVTSPLELASQFTEKLAYMPKTFFIGVKVETFDLYEHFLTHLFIGPSTNVSSFK